MDRKVNLVSSIHCIRTILFINMCAATVEAHRKWTRNSIFCVCWAVADTSEFWHSCRYHGKKLDFCLRRRRNALRWVRIAHPSYLPEKMEPAALGGVYSLDNMTLCGEHNSNAIMEPWSCSWDRTTAMPNAAALHQFAWMLSQRILFYRAICTERYTIYYTGICMKSRRYQMFGKNVSCGERSWRWAWARKKGEYLAIDVAERRMGS